MTGPECDVLIVGAGPTGVTLGLLLARRGVHCIVIDREPEIYPLPRAAHIDHEVMRILQELGLADSVLASSRHPARYDFVTATGDILLRFDGLDRIAPGGWPAGNMIHQPSVEAALRLAAQETPGLELKVSTSLEGLVERDGAIEAALSGPDGAHVIRCRYLVGADGARSPVRTIAGIGIDDLNFDETWLVVDAIVKDEGRLPDANLQVCDPARPTTCVLMGSGRHRWEFMLLPGETAEQVSEPASVATLLAPWKVDGAIEIERTAVYRFNARVAQSWRKGRVLLAGDAAHLMPPFAGQGLCSGLRDAANLAWKLAAVLDGANDALLDTYQVEREPHVRAIISLAMMMGRTVCITDPEAARARDAQMIAARAAGAAPDGAMALPSMTQGCLQAGASGAGTYFPQPVDATTGARLDDALGPGPWLIGGAEDDGHLRAIPLDAPAAGPFRSWMERWLAGHGAEAALVRPDRTVFGTGSAAQLIEAWRAAVH